MKFKWRWHNIFALINSIMCMVFIFLVLSTTISKKKKKATIISGITLLILLFFTILFIFLKFKGELESRRFNIFSISASLVYSIFIISLFIPTGHEVLKDSVGT